MIAQNLELDIFRDVHENAFHFLRYNGNGDDGENIRQTVLWSLAKGILLPMKSKWYV
jgi:hypothetical protein